jgi:hypothetical protein
MARFRHDPPRRKLVSCRQGAFGERDTGDAVIEIQTCSFVSVLNLSSSSCWTAMDKAMPSTDDQLGHCKDGNAAHPMENISTNEFMQLSLEEEGSDELSGISERMVRDVQKSAIELLPARCKLIDDVLLNMHIEMLPGSQQHYSAKQIYVAQGDAAPALPLLRNLLN